MSGFFDSRTPLDTSTPKGLDAAIRRAIVHARAAELGDYPEELEFARVYFEGA